MSWCIRALTPGQAELGVDHLWMLALGVFLGVSGAVLVVTGALYLLARSWTFRKVARRERVGPVSNSTTERTD